MILSDGALHTSTLLIIVIILIVIIILIFLIVLVVIFRLGFSSRARRSTRCPLWSCAPRAVRRNILPMRNARSKTNQHRFTLTSHRRPSPHLLVFLAQLDGLLLEGGTVFAALFRPQLAELLGDRSDGQTGILALHRRPELGAKQKEGRPIENKSDFSLLLGITKHFIQ